MQTCLWLAELWVVLAFSSSLAGCRCKGRVPVEAGEPLKNAHSSGKLKTPGPLGLAMADVKRTLGEEFDARTSEALSIPEPSSFPLGTFRGDPGRLWQVAPGSLHAWPPSCSKLRASTWRPAQIAHKGPFLLLAALAFLQVQGAQRPADRGNSRHRGAL